VLRASCATSACRRSSRSPNLEANVERQNFEHKQVSTSRCRALQCSRAAWVRLRVGQPLGQLLRSDRRRPRQHVGVRELLRGNGRDHRTFMIIVITCGVKCDRSDLFGRPLRHIRQNQDISLAPSSIITSNWEHGRGPPLGMVMGGRKHIIT
jgi:hypothetical protein